MKLNMKPEVNILLKVLMKHKVHVFSVNEKKVKLNSF